MKTLKAEKYPYQGITKMYLQYMHDISVRLKYITSYLPEKHDAKFNKIWIETSCLQLRIICETIMMACLVGNQHSFQKKKLSIDKFYKVHDMERLLKQMHPHYYPKPMSVGGNTPVNIKYLKEKAKHSFSQKELLQLWLDTSDIIHCKNPFGEEQKTMTVIQIFNWCKKISNLLYAHIILLKNFGDKGFLVTVDVFECKHHTMNYYSDINDLVVIEGRE